MRDDSEVEILVVNFTESSMMMSSPRSRLVTTSHAPTGDDDDASVVTLGDDDDIFVDKSTGDFFSTSFVLSTPGILAGNKQQLWHFIALDHMLCKLSGRREKDYHKPKCAINSSVSRVGLPSFVHWFSPIADFRGCV